MLSIIKQLAAEELLSPEQFEQLDLPTIALVIKDTKVGQGLKFLPSKANRFEATVTDLVGRLG